MKDQVTAIVEALQAGGKLKDAQAALLELPLHELPDGGIAAEAAELMKEGRNKSDFLCHAQILLDNCEPTNELARIEGELSQAIAAVGKAHLKVGTLLLEARDACESQAEFLEWSFDKFCIKKAWAFKLMKVAKVFSGEEWASTAPSVLYTLQAQADEQQLEQARELAKAGKLDAKALQSLLGVPEPVKSTNALAQVEELPPFDTGAGDISPRLPATQSEATPANGPKALPVVNVSDSAPSELLERLGELTKALAEAQAKIAELTAPRLQRGAAPMLPQFRSSCMATRLGLSKEEAEDSSKVKVAFRDWVKLGYGRGHEAFELIEEATKCMAQ
ncbi:hypothetical protein vBAspATola_16 [Aeromonas phage vB_AspA_Tola]|nr:hypothetical protein vBAspATola_16 [Aeromonas phage vB_AspA_Tola]